MTKILVIENKISIYEAIKILFEDRECQVIYALTGKDGLDIFGIEKPDVVILDMCLGDMSGLAVLERIKAINPSCRVIVMTTSLLQENKGRALELGADGYISKPFSIVTLNNLVLGA